MKPPQMALLVLLLTIGSSVPAAVVAAFDAALNAGDLDAVLGLFAEDAVVRTQTGTYTGPQQLRSLFRGLLAEHFQFQTSDRRVSGDTETHTARVSTDEWRRLGIAPLEARAEVVVRGGKISSFAVTYTPESLARLQAAQARSAPAQLPRTGEAPSGPVVGWGATLVALTLLSAGLLLRLRAR